MKNTEEIWRNVEDLGNLYQISDAGNFKRLERFVKDSKGKIQHLKEKILKPSAGTYLSIHVSIDGKSHYRNIHRLVARAFIPNPENLQCVNHKNGIKTDNRVENLEWCSYSGNTTHAYLTGLTKASPRTGEDCHFSKLTLTKVKLMKKRVNKTYGDLIKQLCSDFDVSKSTVRAIISESSWRQVKTGYDPERAEKMKG
jgi:hypothetical protein